VTSKTDAAPTAKAAHIRAFENAGYCLIPLNGKIPTIKNWTITGPGEYGEKELIGCNYGVALRAGDLVIDIDPRNFTEGDHPIERLVKAIGAPLNSFTVKTGGGGVHVYFSKPADLSIKSSLKDFPGIEFKSTGRQVVGPGSIHPQTGKPYFVASGNPLEVKEAPTGLLTLLKRTAVPFSELDGKGTGEYKADANTQARYVAYLQDTAEPSMLGQRGDDNAFKVACYGRDLGLPPSITWELMLKYWNPRCKPPWSDEELKSKVIHAYKYGKGKVGKAHPAADFSAHTNNEKEEKLSWTLTAQGHPTKCFHNLLNYFKFPIGSLYKIFGYNEFTGRIEFTRPAPWHHGIMPKWTAVGDNDLKLLKGYLATKHGFEAVVQHIEEAVLNAAYHEKFHPVREYLDSLEWDGKKRLDSWLHDYLGASNEEYVNACGRKTLCAAVMRVFYPGVKFDHVLLLEGAQGIGKSTACKILAGSWSADFPIDPHKPDTIQLMQGKWIVELAELEVTRRADVEALKAFISRSTDIARLAYGRIAGEFPRQSIFIGSKNPTGDETFLRDDSGNRRWWPVRCEPKNGYFDFKGLREVRNQLFAEAVTLMRKPPGEKLYMDTPVLNEAARDAADARHIKEAWTERVGEWLDGMVTTRFITTRQVFCEALGGIDKQLDRRAELRIASALRVLGWHRSIQRLNNRPTRGYIRDNDHELEVLGDLI